MLSNREERRDYGRHDADPFGFARPQRRHDFAESSEEDASDKDSSETSGWY